MIGYIYGIIWKKVRKEVLYMDIKSMSLDEILGLIKVIVWVGVFLNIAVVTAIYGVRKRYS